MFMSSDFKRQLWITLGVLAAGVVVFGSAYYWAINRVNSLTASIIEQRSLIWQGSNLTETLANLKKEKQTVEAYTQALNNLVATRDQLVVNFSKWLNNEAMQYRVGVDFSFQGGETQAAQDNLGYAGFSIKLSGSLNDSVNFLRHLERETRQFLLSFGSFDVDRGPSGYIISANGRVYFK
jgi:hypothetical protein